MVWNDRLCVNLAGVMRSFEDIAGSGGLSAAATNVTLVQKLTREGAPILSLDKSNIVDVSKFVNKEVRVGQRHRY